MYESPIDVFVTQLNVKRREFEEKQILEAVQGVGVNVDRHELEKALLYDRGQYQKGYVDGVKEFTDLVIKNIHENVTPIPQQRYLINMCIQEIENTKKEMVGEG